MPPAYDRKVEQEIRSMLKASIIKPGESSWGFPVVIARKNDGNPRFCIDYLVLKNHMKGDKFSIPSIAEVIEDMAGSRVFSKLDMFAGYWQVQLTERVKYITAFTCKYGSFQFQVMPFGLMNAPESFQRMASEIFANILYVKVYNVDVVVSSKTLNEQVELIRDVCDRIHRMGPKSKLGKCVSADD